MTLWVLRTTMSSTRVALRPEYVCIYPQWSESHAEIKVERHCLSKQLQRPTGLWKEQLCVQMRSGSAIPEVRCGCKGLHLCDREDAEEPLPTSEVVVSNCSVVLLPSCV